MNKKWLTMFTGLLLSAALVGCNNDTDDANDAERNVQEFEEEVEEPFEDPDNDGVDENDLNPED
ncbi:hypothetical protein [Jeotgalibacillus proteolyticus]|uniref:DNA primase n=1 Tax=Jeotgalibacillus proteolyticus TaxID=2082395 RepID=A0A2S5G6X7_9BACL|nr:hypothetical protein [Jeotgalibacillus proteolyticus]PPA68739.1 hypothetical protein C4B60_19430 [Jeotgalibacillus proteolyticus]